jgi:2-iminoacetate synthase
LKNNDYENWINNRIVEEEIEKYLNNGTDFINEKIIFQQLKENKSEDKKKINDILDKSLSVETLTPEETAILLNVEDKDIIEKMKETAAKVKLKVYDNRVVTFAPLYLNNLCVNNCLYCGFRCDNKHIQRRILSTNEIKKEVQILAGKIGHKRLIVVYGESPETDINYICNSIKTIYKVKPKTKNGFGQIRRVNVNAAAMSIAELKQLKESGIGTYQVFQETYNHKMYAKMHPANSIKGNYRWRLYCMHRAFEAGIDDVGIGVLFGLYDWKFEVMSLLYHSIELENKFNIGPHTISFPRLEPAEESILSQNSKYKVSDENFKKLIIVLRLAIPYTGMIITARENFEIRKQAIEYGCTQTDASTRIGIGGYSNYEVDQKKNKQQFMLGDTRSLDEVIYEFAKMGYITSFCTAGYRCGRTGECIMDLLRTGAEGKFCKLNAILTFREWLDDFASEKTKAIGEKVIESELNEVKNHLPKVYDKIIEYYDRIKKGERDLFF